jgi:hypothetical protein
MTNDPPYPKLWQVVLLSIVCVPPMVLAILWLGGAAIESIAQHSEDHERCLRNATNGLEIRDCR